MEYKTYNEYSIAFVDAIQDNNLEKFIKKLSLCLAKNHNNYLAWLFSARAYEKCDNLERAENCYEQAMKLAKPYAKEELYKEINLFKKNLLQRKYDTHKANDSVNPDFKIAKHETNSQYQIRDSKYQSELKRAQLLSQKGDYDAALSIYESIIKNSNNNINIIQFYVIALQKSGNKDKAVNTLDLAIEQIQNEYEKAKLISSKAQILSAFNDFEQAERAYWDLVKSYQIVNKPGKTIAHILQQISLIQYLHLFKHEEALKTIELGRKLKPNDIYFDELTDRINLHKAAINAGEELLIESDDEQIEFISPMLKMDLDDYQFTDEEIIRLDGKPTLDIAERLLNKAINVKEGDLTERFPVYLEAAKAFSELPAGSYLKNEYSHKIEKALAKYAVLKGNSLFLKYIKIVDNQKFDPAHVIRLKDTACSYFIEALNLQYKTNDSILLPITNYLKLQVLQHFISHNSEFEIIKQKGKFADIFRYCLNSQDSDLKKIAFSTIISCGAASIPVWNKLTMVQGGTSFLFGIMRKPEQKREIYALISELEQLNYDITLKPGEFFRIVFTNRKENTEMFEKVLRKTGLVSFAPQNINKIIDNWSIIDTHYNILTITDIEINENIKEIIGLIKPYNSRLPEERTKILHDIRLRFDDVLKFIKENTTYAGRVIFFPIIKKWRQDLSIIEKERFDETIPKIEAKVDPSYYYPENSEFYFNLVLYNIGVATANNIKIMYIVSDFDGKIDDRNSVLIDEELGVKDQKDIKIQIKDKLIKGIALKVRIEVTPIYQGSDLAPNIYEFTLEEEPKNYLTYLDIPWKETSVPIKSLFKGRSKIIEDLVNHYKSIHREFTYILYGLTRTGKTTIIEYLSDIINFQEVYKNDTKLKFISFKWRLEKAAAQTKVEDMWSFLLYDSTLKPLMEESYPQELKDIGNKIRQDRKLRFKDWEDIIDELHKCNYFPVFLIDEFSYYKTLIDSGRLNNAFLASIRQLAFDNKASFLFAGTYDVKSLIKNPKYAITGQLVNTIEYEVNKIDIISAKELIIVMNDKITFTEEAIEHILYLSNRIPYFIQIICKYSGFYAVETAKRFIGYPEVEFVTKILTNEISSQSKMVKPLAPGIFQNNQYSPQEDANEVTALLSTFAYLNKGNRRATWIRSSEIEEFWDKNHVIGVRRKVTEAIEYLKERGILESKEDEQITVYRIGVDLFRRWWEKHNPDIELKLGAL